jgi:thiol-disulfide isomerase/thioredoxin
MGSWCSDSRREVPRFYKILDRLKFDQNKLTLFCVDRSKKDSADDTSKLNIESVPTFIFYRKEKEIGRIIESPKETLEKDIQKIVE